MQHKQHPTHSEADDRLRQRVAELVRARHARPGAKAKAAPAAGHRYIIVAMIICTLLQLGYVEARLTHHDAHSHTTQQ